MAAAVQMDLEAAFVQDWDQTGLKGGRLADTSPTDPPRAPCAVVDGSAARQHWAPAHFGRRRGDRSPFCRQQRPPPPLCTFTMRSCAFSRSHRRPPDRHTPLPAPPRPFPPPSGQPSAPPCPLCAPPPALTFAFPTTFSYHGDQRRLARRPGYVRYGMLAPWVWVVEATVGMDLGVLALGRGGAG